MRAVYLIVQDVLEVLHQEIGDRQPELGRDELAVLLLDVVARLDGARMGRRSTDADAVLLQLLHQRRLVKRGGGWVSAASGRAS